MGKARAKSVPAHIWDQHKELLHNLYIIKGNTVGRVQGKMATKGFYASKHQYRDKFKAWKFKKNCPRQGPAVAATEHGANGTLVMGVVTTQDPEVTTQQFVDSKGAKADVSITTRESAAQSEQVPERESPFTQMAPEILHVDYPVLQDEQNIPANGVFPFEASFDPQPASNQWLVEAEHPQPNAGNYGYPNPEDINQNVINESTQNGSRYLEVSVFDNVSGTTAIDPLDLVFLFKHDDSGNDLNYSWPSRRFP